MPTKPYNSPDYWQPFTKTEEITQRVNGLDDQLKHAIDLADAPVQLQQGRLQICRTANSFWLLYPLIQPVYWRFEPAMIPR